MGKSAEIWGSASVLLNELRFQWKVWGMLTSPKSGTSMTSFKVTNYFSQESQPGAGQSVFFPERLSRFCLHESWSRQNLSRLHNQPQGQVLSLFICWVIIQPHKVSFNLDLGPGQLPWWLYFRVGSCYQKWQGSSRENRRRVLWNTVHTSNKLADIGGTVIQWWRPADTFAVPEGPMLSIEVSQEYK